MKHRLEVLEALAEQIAGRRNASPQESYTARLLGQGREKCAKKLGEEAVEAALAAMTADREHLTAEAADVIYHLLVLLQSAEVPLAKVMTELELRMARGRLAEKTGKDL
jgi:phosphoribosyl-ATP pyrophosphohydrolase